MNFISFAGGLGLLLYGIRLMGEGLELAAGARLKKLLEKMTGNRFLAVLVGIGITTLIQSSSATTVMVVGFVNTGLMDLMQAAGVIMGANIGTTTTGVLVSLNLVSSAPIAVCLGAFMTLFAKKKVQKYVGQALTGFGMLFMGMQLMQTSMVPLQSSEIFKNWLVRTNNPFLGVLIGACVTAVIQSSAASVGILQALASKGLVPIGFAVYIICGLNIGTCVTALLSAIGTKTNSKRTAVMHILFNVFGTLIFLLVAALLPLTNWIAAVSDKLMAQIALTHIVFNVVSTLILFPFSKLLVRLSCLLVPEKEPAGEQVLSLQFVDDRMLGTPPLAVAQVGKEVLRMAKLARNNLEAAVRDLLSGELKHQEEVEKTEELVNYLNHHITPILVEINELELSVQDSEYVGRLFHVVNDIERIGDHATNLEEAAQSRKENDLKFTEEGTKELEEMCKTVFKLLDGSIEVFEAQELSPGKARLLNSLEEKVDEMQKSFEQSYIDRLNRRECTTRAGTLFIHTVTDFERVADHAVNIAWSVKNRPQAELSPLPDPVVRAQ